MTNDATQLDSLISSDIAHLDEIMQYARFAATDIIDATRHEFPDATDIDIARAISADATESASFTNLPCDPEILFILISLIICDRLNCDDSDISSEY